MNFSLPRRARHALPQNFNKLLQVILARGGSGGHGNNLNNPFSSARGAPGEKRRFLLELKSIADVGLVGFPNAGKSTLLAALTRANPKIAPYPFTTLSPSVGAVKFRDGSELSVADVPGLVEDAHLGTGLGFEFLRHLERTKLLLFVIDADSAKDVVRDLAVLRNEVQRYAESKSSTSRASSSPSSTSKSAVENNFSSGTSRRGLTLGNTLLASSHGKFGVVLNKCDLGARALRNCDRLHAALEDEVAAGRLERSQFFVRAISAADALGLEKLVADLRLLLLGSSEECAAAPSEEEEEVGGATSCGSLVDYEDVVPEDGRFVCGGMTNKPML